MYIGRNSVVQDTIAQQTLPGGVDRPTDCENNSNGHEDSAATTSVASVSR